MRLRKIRRTNHTNNGWKVIRRCVIFFTAICLVPVFLVFMVATDHYYARPRIPLNHPIGSELIQLDQHHRSRNNVSMFVLKRLEQRRTHLRKTCHLLGLDKIGNDTLHTPNSWEYLVDEKHHLIWCNVFKAASTSWMYNFNILAGYSPTFLRRSRTPPLTLARKKYGRPSLEFLRKAFRNKKSLSFLIVRHPLERLLSAYRDKIKYAVSGSYHFKLGKEIIKNYRKIRNAAPKYPTYPEFVAWLIDSVKAGKSLDMHWTPVVEFCTPCMFDIKVIAHTETLEEDQELIIKRAGLENIIKPQWQNAGKGSTTKQISSHYSLLTRSQILQLYHIFRFLNIDFHLLKITAPDYRFDFELFNYSLNGYLEVGQPDQDPSALLAAITMQDNQPDSVPHIY